MKQETHTGPSRGEEYLPNEKGTGLHALWGMYFYPKKKSSTILYWSMIQGCSGDLLSIVVLAKRVFWERWPQSNENRMPGKLKTRKRFKHLQSWTADWNDFNVSHEQKLFGYHHAITLYIYSVTFNPHFVDTHIDIVQWQIEIQWKYKLQKAMPIFWSLKFLSKARCPASICSSVDVAMSRGFNHRLTV